MSDIHTNDAEARLARFFAEDGLPDRDPAFSARIGQRIARRRLQRDLLMLAGVTAMGVLVLWALAPGLSRIAGALVQTFSPVLVVGLFLGSLVAAAAPVLRRV